MRLHDTLPTLALAALAALTPSCTETVPTTAVGAWDLVVLTGTAGERVATDHVFSLELRPDGTVAYVSCLNPTADAAGNLSCRERARCGTGTYTLQNGALTLRQTARTDTRSGVVSFEPGYMAVDGPQLIASWVATSRFRPIGALSRDCDPLP